MIKKGGKSETDKRVDNVALEIKQVGSGSVGFRYRDGERRMQNRRDEKKKKQKGSEGNGKK